MPSGGQRLIVLQSLLHFLWSICHAESIREWDAARARFLGLRGQRLQRFAVRQPQGTPTRTWRHFG